MTEDDAKAWVRSEFGSQEFQLISQFVDLVRFETQRQNLIAASTIETIWARHVVDSLQLLGLVSDLHSDRWLDIGTGGGFPGMVVALARPARRTILVEPRRLRADFLARATVMLGVSQCVSVIQQPMKLVSVEADVISARAVGKVEDILAMAVQSATQTTRWLLPRGIVEPAVIDELTRTWSFVFHVEQSLVSPDSKILILDRVRRR